MFKRLKSALTRPPIPVRSAAQAQAELPVALRSLLCLGRRGSPLHLTQLEALRDWTAVAPEFTRGLIIGLPFDRVERTLAAAGFNTAENLLSLNTSRAILRFEDPATGAYLHLNDSEFGRDDAPAPGAPGQPFAPPAEYIFNDWLADAPGELRHRVTGRRIARPARLIFRETFITPAAGAYDGIAADLPRDEIIARLRYFQPLGLNAATFVKSLVALARLTDRPLALADLATLILDGDERLRRVEFLAATQDDLSAADAEEAAEVIDTLIEIGERTPVMAVELAEALRREIIAHRTPHPLADFLTPGKLWHIGTATHADRFLAYCLKRDLQRHLLEAPSGMDRTVIFADEWVDHFAPALDSACIAHSDIIQCYGITDAAALLDRHGEAVAPMVRAFPRHAWHISNETETVDLLSATYPFIAHSRQQLAYLPWERRLEEHAGALRESPVNLNIDGREVQERASRSKVSRTIERGGFAH